MHFTQNPIGSDNQLDLQDNAISFDYAMNSPAALWQDRFGKQHKTVQQALKDVGFKPAGFDFVSGGTLGIGDRDKCVFYPTDGYWYSWNGKLPYVIPANSSPTPGGKKGWGVVTRDERVIAREALRRSYAEAGYTLRPKPESFNTGGMLTSALDVLLDETTGKVYSHPGPYPLLITAGTNPNVGGYIDRSTTLPRIITTVAGLATGTFSVGTRLELSDRAGGLFLIAVGGTPNGTHILDAGNGNTAVYQIPHDGVVNVKALGGKSGIDSSLAVKHACALSTKVHFPDDDIYEITFPVNANFSFVTYTDKQNVRITGPNATIKDVNTYCVDFLTNIFKFVNCKGVYVDVGCDAKVLPNIAAPYPNGIGYNGSAFIYLEGFCERAVVDSVVKNVRYGIRQGGYSDPALGGANDITAKLRCYQVGYPVAFYNASNVKLDIDSNIQHRAAYITGCSNVRGTVAMAGFTYAAIGVLIADGILEPSTVDAERRAYGGDNIHINVVDRGSTGTQSNRATCGITGAWKAPNTTFNDIHVHLSVKCNNANRTLAGFRLENTVGWYNTNEFNNIKVSGTIDRSEQTYGASAWADFTINGIEAGEVGPYPNSPKFNGIDLAELQIINASATGNVSQVLVPNAIGVINLSGAKMSGASLSINAPNARVILTNASAGVIAGQGIKFPALNTGVNGYRVNDDGTIEQWMLVNYTATPNTDQTFTFPTPFPNAARVPSVVPVGVSSITATVNGLTANSITLRCSVTGTSLYIRLIGY